MKIKKGDNVLIIQGKDKGKTGKVLKALVQEQKLLVEGMNIKKKHMKPKRQGEKGQMVNLSVPVDVSNAKLVCPKCGKATRVGYSIDDKKNKTRVCKICKSEI